MSGYGRDHDRTGFNPHSREIWGHFAKRRTEDEASDEYECTNTLPKRPKLADAAPDYTVAKLSHEAYTVGWVCALPLERAAAEAMLDDIHPSLDMNPKDSNAYTFGRIGPHNIVIVCLPSGQYGTNSAAVVANNMRWSFPSIRIGLMVGIGGGVPGKVDIRLGDVVVSNPTGDSSGVVQYDFGKAVHDGRFERIGTLNKPPQSVLTAVAKLRASHDTRPNQIPAILADMEERYPYMSEFLYKSMDEDRLFRASYEHAGGDTCDDCDMSKVVERDPRPAAATPNIHYGIIASGNQVIKHAGTRDRLAKDLGLICFEMEAAGLMDNFPCLVVRGICDYSDSHKAKQWQRYAAATAAAYAKELLYCITPHKESKSTAQAAAPDTVQSPQPPGHRKMLLDSLKFSQIDKRQANIKGAHAKTCEWLVEHPDYAAWMDRQKYAQHHGFLWIRGKPGAGKSTLMKFAFTRAKRNKRKHGTLISFFFNARGDGLEKTTLGMYRSLVYQLLDSMPDLQTLLDDPDLAPLGHPDSEGCGLDQLKNLFRSAVRRLAQRQLTCFIDALDECDDNEVSDMFKCFEDLGQYAVQNDIRFYVCFSSRHYPYIDIFYGQKLVLEDQIGHGKDLEDYVRSKLRAGSGPKSEQVVAEILRKASGVFMWVVLVVDILNKEYGKGRLFAVEKRLKDIPSELSKLFQNILTRDQEDMEDLLLCIQLLLYSQRPLKQEEYYFAIASGLEPDTLGEWDPEDITHDFMDRLIVHSSKGLAETTGSDDMTVQFIHESVRDFLLKDDGLRTLWSDMGDDFEGRSHDRLKNCCHTYSTQVNILAYLPDDKFMLTTSKDDAQRSRERVTERFPFLEYATNQVLYHAEAAAVHGISQKNFIKGFEVDSWIQMNNLFEKTKVRRHKPASTSLLYIAAAKGLTRLIKTTLEDNLDVDTVGGRYNYPILAAIIEGHEDTAHVLLDCIATRSQQNEVGAHSDVGHRRGGYTISPSLDYKDKKGRTALYYAAQSKEIGIAKRLFEVGANPDFHMGSFRVSPLVRAVEKNNDAFVRLYLQARSESQSSLSRVRTPSSLALSNEEHDGEERLQVLEERTMPSPGEDRQTSKFGTRACDEDVSWALAVAAGTGNEDIARLLLHSGADVRGSNHDGETPLHVACKHSKEAIVWLLLNAGADVNQKGRAEKAPLHSTAHAGIAKLLLASGAQIESADENGWTPLHSACWHGRLAVAEVLVKAGAKLDALDKNGNTPLHLACHDNTPETASFLLEAGADVDATNNDGETPLFKTVYYSKIACLDVLLSHGADINHRDKLGRTPIFEVIRHCNDDFQRFLDKQPDLTIINYFDETPLFELEPRWSESSLIAKLIVGAGVDVMHRNNKGQTFLHVAATNHDPTDEFLCFLQWVFEQGFDVNARDNTGRTPLLDAAKGRNEQLVAFLIPRGGDLDAADDQGWTPLSTAIAFGRPKYLVPYAKLAVLLLENGADPGKPGPNGEGLVEMAMRSGRYNELIEPLKTAMEKRLLIRHEERIQSAS